MISLRSRYQIRIKFHCRKIKKRKVGLQEQFSLSNQLPICFSKKIFYKRFSITNRIIAPKVNNSNFKKCKFQTKWNSVADEVHLPEIHRSVACDAFFFLWVRSLRTTFSATCWPRTDNDRPPRSVSWKNNESTIMNRERKGESPGDKTAEVSHNIVSNVCSGSWVAADLLRHWLEFASFQFILDNVLEKIALCNVCMLKLWFKYCDSSRASGVALLQ